MNDTKVIDNFEIAKWLRVVMYIAIASLVNTLVGGLPFIPDGITAWISRGITVVMIISMIKLAPANDRYKKAGILRAVMLAFAIAIEVFDIPAMLILAVSILSIVADYQEYHGHSELIEDLDHSLSGKWTSLFMWSILAGIIVGFTSTAAVVLVALAEMDTIKATTVVAAILAIPQYIIVVLYILYLKKMVALFQVEREVQKDDC